MFSAIKAYFGHLLEVPDAVSPARYRSLRRIMTILMVTVSVTPLLILTGINHAQYMSTLEREMENPLYAMVRKSQASMELFLGERASTVSLIAHAYSFDDLTNEQTLNRVFLALKSEFQGFVDMGLVDVNGRQVAYVGPYKLKDADYAGQPWLSEAQVKGRYISDVFLGLRGFPHMVIAVHRMEESGREWTLRVTIDTSRLERLVAAVGLMQDTDAFLCDSRGVLQTNSRFYGKVLDKLPLTLPPQSFETTVRPWKDDSGQDLMVAYTSLAGTDFMLLAVKPTLDIYKPWTALRSELLLVFCGGIAIIVLVSHLLMKHLVGRLQASDERRVAVFAQMEHNQKLSSIGRLAAGVAHEVNNPLAVINEKAGLGLDLLHMSGNFERKDRLISLLEAIESTVERARGITHRLLGFARRMEANRQELSVPEVLTETMGFLERGAKNRGVTIGTDFAEGLPDIVSDRGQLQQVFLNIMGNALDAVPDGGKVDIACSRMADGGLLVRVTDNGITAKRIIGVFLCRGCIRGRDQGACRLAVTVGACVRIQHRQIFRRHLAGGAFSVHTHLALIVQSAKGRRERFTKGVHQRYLADHGGLFAVPEGFAGVILAELDFLIAGAGAVLAVDLCPAAEKGLAAVSIIDDRSLTVQQLAICGQNDYASFKAVKVGVALGHLQIAVLAQHDGAGGVIVLVVVVNQVSLFGKGVQLVLLAGLQKDLALGVGGFVANKTPYFVKTDDEVLAIGPVPMMKFVCRTFVNTGDL